MNEAETRNGMVLENKWVKSPCNKGIAAIPISPAISPGRTPKLFRFNKYASLVKKTSQKKTTNTDGHKMSSTIWVMNLSI